jgi:hypothetical protein
VTVKLFRLLFRLNVCAKVNLNGWLAPIFSETHQRRIATWRSNVQFTPLILTVVEYCHVLIGIEWAAAETAVALVIGQSRRKSGCLGGSKAKNRLGRGIICNGFGSRMRGVRGATEDDHTAKGCSCSPKSCDDIHKLERKPCHDPG